MHNAFSCNLSQVVPSTKASNKNKNSCWHQRGSSLPGLRTLDAPHSPPSTPTDIIRIKCLNNVLTISVSFFDFKLNQKLFGLVSNLKKQSHLFLV
jgi:hypothetical protein